VKKFLGFATHTLPSQQILSFLGLEQIKEKEKSDRQRVREQWVEKGIKLML